MRTNFYRRLVLFIVLFISASVTVTAATRATPTVTPSDTVSHKGLPVFGKWMIAPDGTYAHWLGERYNGKTIREPINIVLVDGISKSADEAKARLAKACANSGYPARSGHSSGYNGFIDKALYGQLPLQKDHAFSNEPFEFTNNHGRIFGPALFDGRYYFIGALSREKVAPLEKVKHAYVSFNRARDEFANALDQNGAYKKEKLLPFNNVLLNDPEFTTGDHDGVVILLNARP